MSKNWKKLHVIKKAKIRDVKYSISETWKVSLASNGHCVRMSEKDKYWKILETILQKFKILSWEPFLCLKTIQYPCFKPEIVSLAQRSIHLEHDKNFQEISNANQKLLKQESEKIDYHPINSRYLAAAYWKTLEEVPGPLVPEKKIKNMKKL